MLRSMARIQVGVNISTENGPSDGTDFFKLTEVQVYNARKIGYAVPLPENLDAAGKVILPSLTAGSELIDEAEMIYTLTPGDNNQLTRTIYVNETVNEDQDPDDLLFLILEGYYTPEGEPENTTVPTYYRVDFYTQEDEETNLLRNYSYNINVTGVYGPGEDDKEKAKKTITKNMEVSLTDWPDGQMKYVVFNGQYYLAVSESTISLPKEAGTSDFLVKTNYISGWKAAVTKGNSWLDGLDPTSSPNKDVFETLAFTVTENNENQTRGG